MAHADVRGVGAFGGGGKCGVICKGQEVPLTQSGDLPASQGDLPPSDREACDGHRQQSPADRKDPLLHP